MKLSSKVRYGFRFMVNLALDYGTESLVQIKEIASKENISSKYLEQIASSFKVAGLVNVVRGSKGGYMLAKSPELITLLEIYHAVDGPLSLTDCSNTLNMCPNGEECIMNTLWRGLNQNIEEYFSDRTLKDLLAEAHCCS